MAVDRGSMTATPDVSIPSVVVPSTSIPGSPSTNTLTTPSAISAYLTAHSIPYTAITPLSGGYTNFIFLVKQPNGTAFIFKHTSTTIKAFPTMTASVDRADTEVTALRLIPDLLVSKQQNGKASSCHTDLDVHLPVLLDYDATAHVQRHAPAGVRTLKDAYQDDPQLDVSAIGRRLGCWLAKLHAITPVPDALGDNARGKRSCGSSYRGAPTVLEKAGLLSEDRKANAFREVCGRYEPLLMSEDENICHGDFWPGNVLLPERDDVLEGDEIAKAAAAAVESATRPASATSSARKDSPRLTVLDWEMSRRGNGATDIGQFAAEAWLLDTFRGGRGLLTAFLGGYADEIGSRSPGGTTVESAQHTTEFAKRAAVHMGAHLAYWPSMVAWADEEGTRGILKFGRDLVVGVEEGGLEWLRESVLARLVTGV